MKRISFLFGSGISLASAAPSVKELTRSVLEDRWLITSRKTFIPDGLGRQDAPLDNSLRYQDFIKLLYNEISPAIESLEEREANYEDLYAAAISILEHEMKVRVNPLIVRTIQSLRISAQSLYEGQGYHIDENEFASLVDRARDLIQWAVYHGLAKAKEPKGLGVLSALARREIEMDIFTLNHDRLIEQEFRNNKIYYHDGFSQKDGDVVFFEPKWDSERIRLIKLHGSTDWYRFQLQDLDRFGRVDANTGLLKDRSGELLSTSDPCPKFLSGTHAKEFNYGRNLFGELFSQFRNRLKTCQALVCCGYGWGDKGINNRLSEWLVADGARRVVVLHGGKPEDVGINRYYSWSQWKVRKRIHVIPKWLCQCSIRDLIRWCE
ncbi:MAG TPA: SIR2 family protein [Opitutaceae bacterium]|nr:SIR2 family protein [Opitutaceae bacterium]